MHSSQEAYISLIYDIACHIMHCSNDIYKYISGVIKKKICMNIMAPLKTGRETLGQEFSKNSKIGLTKNNTLIL